MHRRVYVPLPPPVLDALLSNASKEWRRPSEQAAVLIQEALVNRGLINEAYEKLPAATKREALTNEMARA